jgi:hypothetical protein
MARDRVGESREGAMQSGKMVPEQTGGGPGGFVLGNPFSAPLARALCSCIVVSDEEQPGTTLFTVDASKSDKHAGHLTKVPATN